MKRIPYSPKELEIIGHVPAPGMDFTHEFTCAVVEAPVYNTPVTPKENYLALLRGEKPLWLPMGRDFNMFVPSILPDNKARGMAREAEPFRVSEVGGLDMFGIDWEYVPSVGGSTVRPGTAPLEDACDWEKVIKFPDIEQYDWERSAKLNEAINSTGKVNQPWFMTGLFERLISFMDFENAAVALIDEEQQEGVHSLFSALCELYKKIMDKYRKYYKCDVFYFHDDWGSQRSPFFSLDTCREMLVPYLKELADYAHKNGMFFEHHSCGKNEMLVPAMIEAGVDVWNPQPMNDIPYLLKEYSDKLHFSLFPLTPMGPTTAPEEAKKAGEEFVEAYKAYPSIVMPPFISAPAICDVIYEATRKSYNNL